MSLWRRAVCFFLLISPGWAMAADRRYSSPRSEATNNVSAILAEFRDRGSWDYTTVEAAARVSLLNGDDGELRIEVAPSSSEFKFFSEPHAAIIVTDKPGQIIASND